jgi:hypothetical protein
MRRKAKENIEQEQGKQGWEERNEEFMCTHSCYK